MLISEFFLHKSQQTTAKIHTTTVESESNEIISSDDLILYNFVREDLSLKAKAIKFD